MAKKTPKTETSTIEKTAAPQEEKNKLRLSTSIRK